MNEQTIPTTPEVVNYPIKRVAGVCVNSETSMSPSLLWRMQQAVAEAKFNLLHLMLEEGYVPVSDDKVEWHVEVKTYVERRAVDGEATEDKWLSVPVHLDTLSVMQYNGL